MFSKEKIKSSKHLSNLAHWLMAPKNDARPRWWIRNIANRFIHKRGKGVTIRSNARIDAFPYNNFYIGEQSLIEDFAVINNGVGEVKIGDETIIGIGCVLIGPVEIGNNVMLAQHIVISGLNHGYEDVLVPPSKQPVTWKKITIEDNVWIGANAVITAGVTIGKHSVIGAGSVVTKNVEPYCIAVGNPARVMKKYNADSKKWEAVK